jgi:hypothetical protein
MLLIDAMAVAIKGKHRARSTSALRGAFGRVAQEAIFQDACFQPLVNHSVTGRHGRRPWHLQWAKSPFARTCDGCNFIENCRQHEGGTCEQ